MSDCSVLQVAAVLLPLVSLMIQSAQTITEDDPGHFLPRCRACVDMLEHKVSSTQRLCDSSTFISTFVIGILLLLLLLLLYYYLAY